MKDQTVHSYLAETTGRAWVGIGFSLLAQAAQAAAGVMYALFLRNVINAAVSGDKSGFFAAILALAGLFLASLALSAMRRYLDVAVHSDIENRFKARLFHDLLTRDYAVVSALHSGEWMNRLTSDVSVVAGGMNDILPSLTGMAVKLIGAVGMIIALEPRFLYLIVPGGALLIVCSTLFRKQMKKLHKAIQEKDGALRTFLQDSLGSLLVVRAYSAEGQTMRRAADRMNEHRNAKLRRNRFSNAANVGFGLVMQGASVLGAFFCGYGILTGSMDYGSFTAVLNLIGQIQAPFANISGVLPRYYAMIASAERLMEIERVAREPAARAMRLSAILARYETDFEGFGVENARFAYPMRGQQLSDALAKDPLAPLPDKLTLHFQKGEYAAFLGPSGCGKSTALKLLMGLYPLESGERYVLCGGKKLPLDGEWQRLFAYVPQGNHLMSGSIREIVAYADPNAMRDEARIRRALTIACAEFVFELETGMDTVLGERGTGISEGQMQRIAIARAIFSDHPILMLDECTSALDEATERRLLDNLRGMTDRTVLVITHRSAALEICDKTVSFTEGSVDICKIPRE